MNYQKGNTLVITLIMLTILTLVAAYNMESSGLQSRMLSSSVHAIETNRVVERSLKQWVRAEEAAEGDNLKAIESETSFGSAMIDKTTVSRSAEMTKKEQPNPFGGGEIDELATLKYNFYEMTSAGTWGTAQASHTYGVAVSMPSDPNTQSNGGSVAKP